MYKTDFAEMVYQQAYENEVDPALVFAIIKEESGFNANAVSRVGAVGLMQIMPSTATAITNQNFNVELLKEEIVNINIGCSYLRYLINKFENVNLAIIAYNAGEGNLLKWINENQLDEDFNTPFSQTNAFLQKVLDSYRVYRKILTY